MPRLDKACITQFAGSACEKQLRIAMHPDDSAYAAERQALDLAHPQVRPALQAITAAGDEWGECKYYELTSAFGSERVTGKNPRRDCCTDR